MSMTPLELRCLIDIYVGSELSVPATDVRRHAMNDLVRNGLVEGASSLPSGHDTTELGNAFMSLILSTPIPDAKFIDPRDGSIIQVQK